MYRHNICQKMFHIKEVCKTCTLWLRLLVCAKEEQHFVFQHHAARGADSKEIVTYQQQPLSLWRCLVTPHPVFQINFPSPSFTSMYINRPYTSSLPNTMLYHHLYLLYGVDLFSKRTLGQKRLTWYYIDATHETQYESLHLFPDTNIEPEGKLPK